MLIIRSGARRHRKHLHVNPSRVRASITALRRYSEVLQRSELRRHALALAYALAARLAQAGACVGGVPSAPGAPALASPLLAPLNVLLQWLASQPEYVRCVPFFLYFDMWLLHYE